MRVAWELSDQVWMRVCSTHACGQTRMRVVWELYKSWVTRFGWGFVQLSCVRSNEDESCMRVEDESCMRVEWPGLDEGLFNSCVRSNEDESCIRVEWPDLDEGLFNSHACGQTRMRVVWELSDQVWMRVCSTHACGQTRMGVVWESRDQIWMRVLFNSRACGQTRMRVV